MSGLSKLFFLFFVLSYSCNNQLLAQGSSNQEGSQHLLWYTGHWDKNKKNTFITDAFTDSSGGPGVGVAAGQAITVTPGGGIHINSGEIDDWNKKIEDGVKSMEKAQKQLSDPANEGQEWAYHFYQVAKSQLDTIKAAWSGNKIEKSENPLQVSHESSNGQSAIIKAGSDWCEKMKPEYDRIIAFYTAHKKDRSSDYVNLAPPELDYTCVACDTNLAKKNEKISKDYVEKFLKPENDLIREGFKIERDLLSSGIVKETYASDDPAYSIYYSLFHINNSDPSKSGPCAYLDRNKLDEAIRFMVMRCMWRADKLLSDNRKNFKVAVPVIRAYLAAAKVNEQLGMKLDLRFADLGLMALDAYHYYFNRLSKDHDWSQLANIPYILGLARQYSLLTNDLSVDEDIKKLWSILSHFELNIEMDIKIGKDDAYLLTHVKGKAKIAPEFAYSSNNCYQWVVTEDAPNQAGQPLKKGDQKIKIDLLNNQVIIKGGSPTYTGTKNYWCRLAMLKMDYCHPGADSILVSPFWPDPPMAGTWVYPNGVTVPSAINGLDQYFRNIDQMVHDAKSGALQEGAEDIKKRAEVAMQHAKALQAKMGNGKMDVSNLKDYQNLLNEMNALRGGATNAALARTVNDIAFPLNSIQNNSTTLFKKRYDAKEINPSIGGEAIIIYGYYTVEIVYQE
jgi:hypothetical protein